MSKSYRWVPVLTLISDYVALLAAEWCALFLRNWLVLGWDGVFVGKSMLHLVDKDFWFIIPALYIFVFSVEHLYSRRAQFWQLMKQGFRACTYATLLIIFLLYATKTSIYSSRLFVVFMGVMAFILVSLARYILKKLFERMGIMQIPILIIGAGKVATRLVDGITHDAGMGYKIIGFLEDKPEGKPLLERYPLLGGFADAERVIKETGVNYVAITATKMYRDEMNGLVYRIQPLVKHLTVVPNVIGIPMCGLQVESLFSERLMVLRTHNNLANWFNRVMKFVFDYVLTIVGVICLSPVFLILALYIYKEDPGPIFYKHMRVGRNGKVFPCYKFRSMCVNSQERLEELLANDPVAREEWDKSFKLKNDPRITKIGAKLRKTSLDELPQLFNVLRGEMSLVGPRPVVQKELDEYYGDNARLYKMVRPGITGMWQVNGRSDVDYDERIAMDNWYICNWNIWLDIMLLWKTVKVVLCGKGAY